MPYFSFFWKKHYGDIGNCCMTKPLDETTVPGTNGSRLVSYVDVTWMSDIKLKWIGWDKGGDYAWITPDGMIYRFTDLKRNERGMKYEKEVQKLELWSGGWGTDGPPENLYEWELSVQENCGFCKSTPGGKKGEKEEKDDETGDKDTGKDGGVNMRDWKEFADSKPDDEKNDITRTSETTNTEHVTNTGKTAYDDALENAKGGGGGKKGADESDDEDNVIAKLPYKDLIKLPAKPDDDEQPIYRKIPEFTKPKHQNPVLDNKNVLDTKKVIENKKITDTSKIKKSPFFQPPMEEEPIDNLRVWRLQDNNQNYERKSEEKDQPKSTFKKNTNERVQKIDDLDDNCDPQSWLAVAGRELGQQRDQNKNQSNPRILDYFKYTDLKDTQDGNTDETAWCAAFVNFCLGKVGIKGTNSALAFSFMRFGKALGAPALGSIAVLNYSHVAFVIGKRKDGKIVLLGGNQSPRPNRVNITVASPESIKSYRYPTNCAPQYNLPILDIQAHSTNYKNTR